MTPVAGPPRATSRGPADYGTDWSQVRQRPPDTDVPTPDELGDGVIPTGSPAAHEPTHVPVWVHRMHGDGLPSTNGGAMEPRHGSQRFVKRWKDAAGGY